MTSFIRTPLLRSTISSSLAAPRTASIPRRVPSVYSRTFASTRVITMPNKHNNKGAVNEHVDNEKAGAADQSHQFQSGATTDRQEDEWKHREPYKIHDDDSKFPAKWTGGCHCGKVQYQLSRDRPLASKYCHCTTCQRLHGVG